MRARSRRVSTTGRQHAMYNLPTWAVWTAAVAVGAGPGWRSSRHRRSHGYSTGCCGRARRCRRNPNLSRDARSRPRPLSGANLNDHSIAPVELGGAVRPLASEVELANSDIGVVSKR
jgi:hypothetical protein